MKKGYRKPHILIIDDEEIIRNLITDILEDSEYRVTAIGNGKEALEIFSSTGEGIDLVLLDIIMPVMSGSEVLRKLRKIDPLIKVILLSGYSKDGEIEELLSLGGVDFLQKPISIKELKDRIQECLEKSKV